MQAAAQEGGGGRRTGWRGLVPSHGAFDSQRASHRGKGGLLFAAKSKNKSMRDRKRKIRFDSASRDNEGEKLPKRRMWFPCNDAPENEKQLAVKMLRVCFKHAQGEECSQHAEGRCRLSHDNKVLPQGGRPNYQEGPHEPQHWGDV